MKKITFTLSNKNHFELEIWNKGDFTRTTESTGTNILENATELKTTEDGTIDVANLSKVIIYNNRVYSVEMAAISDEDVPSIVLKRVVSIFNPHQWYRDNSHKGSYDTVVCNVSYKAKTEFESHLKIWFGFIRVKEDGRDNNFIWIFNSIFMQSTVSGNLKRFGCNSFKDADFKKEASCVSGNTAKKITALADAGKDDDIAKGLGLKLCALNSIFELCNEARKGRFI